MRWIAALILLAGMAHADEFVIRRGFEIPVIKAPNDPTQYACKIRTTHGIASGVVTSAGVLTCWHVVNGEDRIDVTNGMETARATVLAKDVPGDLALLSVAWKTDRDVADIATSEPAMKAGVRSCGRCKDGTLTVEEHTIVSIRRGEIEFTNASNAGRSGAGVFDNQGKLVGIIRGNFVGVEPYTGRSADLGAIRKLIPEVDDRPEMWMFTADGTWCAPCNTGKAELNAAGKSLPFKLVIKIGIPAWLPDAKFPTFYWRGSDDQYKKIVGWPGKDVLVSEWHRTRTKVEQSYRNAELKVGHAAQRKLLSISEKDGKLPLSVIEKHPAVVEPPRSSPPAAGSRANSNGGALSVDQKPLEKVKSE